MFYTEKKHLTIAIPKGKLFNLSTELLSKIGINADNLNEKSRKLIISNTNINVDFIISKTTDVPTYVEYGAADIGIIGKDILEEASAEIYELLDLGFGKCHIMMAAKYEHKNILLLKDYENTRVATKFPNIARRFFVNQGMQMEYIRLNGSVELGPLVGLSESIVDIVETGITLQENNLYEIAHIMDSSARLIANRVSYKLKFERINSIVMELKDILESE